MLETQVGKLMDKVFIIAEAGVNHNGDIEIAKKMIKAAVDAGVDAIKFQTFKAENLVTKTANKADYQKNTTPSNETQYEMIKRLEIEETQYVELMEYCTKLGIMFLSSPFDLESIELLANLGLNIYKIPSGEITNLPYLRKIGSLKKQVILSTGMSDLGEIEDALDILIAEGTHKEDITILHCNTEYPTNYEDVNLNAMLTIKNCFDINIGYSDHTNGIEVPIAAVAIGAKVIEKHFTLDRNMEGPDHKASLQLDELKLMVDSIRNIEKALGNGIKKPSFSELKNKSVARKSIVAIKNIQKGEFLTVENIGIKRPGIGISPMRWDEILGRTAVKDFEKDDLIII